MQPLRVAINASKPTILTTFFMIHLSFNGCIIRNQPKGNKSLAPKKPLIYSQLY
ncbi:hypothetical protein D083_3966 [Dickeya solani RNS 08.23.3.1.A]|nr:hypothetical protein D083_3966 [Dickeya solani RNS 08.23.3.1.A]QKO17453.1 hypothetical protein HAT92_01364 [Dickeya solani]